MTTEQFERAKELERQIKRLKNLLETFKETEIDDSPSRMTGFNIKKSFHEGYIHNIENFELELFINAIESKIAVLEHEFNRL